MSNKILFFGLINFCIVISSCCVLQSKKEPTIIQIKSGNYEAPLGYIHTISNHCVKVQECDNVRGECKNSRVVYREKLSPEEIEKINVVLLKHLSQTDSLYEWAALGGFFWQVNIWSPYTKKVFIDNAKVPEVDSLFITINKTIRIKKMHIPLTCF